MTKILVIDFILSAFVPGLGHTYLGKPKMGITIRIISIIFSKTGMMAFSGLVFILLTQRLYIYYSVYAHIEAGTYVIIMS